METSIIYLNINIRFTLSVVEDISYPADNSSAPLNTAANRKQEVDVNTPHNKNMLLNYYIILMY